MKSVVPVGSLLFSVCLYQCYRAAGPNEDWEWYCVLMSNHSHFDHWEKLHLLRTSS
ncbi:hypothetical protein LDL79_02015 [Leeuwenhoekiella palythoae]|uniref:hypothetical protein n=1 Tax=Leeuwenhoekiella palythoae TaxID=573501 RepID=UPI001CE1ADD2|nr:hypothetical protein [Leeuwenhoekiella palythoae]UBZ10904.1 hypothetical protein LDL79_02015 [Leeuwenhoekiella palythoae]